MRRVSLIFAGLSGAAAVSLSAWLSHASTEVYQSILMALSMQFVHTIALLVLALSDKFEKNPLYLVSLFTFIGGICFFCGAIYIKLLFGVESVGKFTPIGGLLFIIGWLSVAALGNKKL